MTMKILIRDIATFTFGNGVKPVGLVSWFFT